METSLATSAATTLVTLRPELLTLTQEQLIALGPVLCVLIGSLIAIVFSVMKVFSPKWFVFMITLVTCVTAFALSFQGLEQSPLVMFNSMLAVDSFSNLFNLLFLGSAALTILASIRYLDSEQLQHPEYYVLILFATIGMMLLAQSLDLIVIFIALEIMSLSTYTLVGFRRSDRRSNEAALKYFVLGGVASAVFLYGAALTYGATGTTQTLQILKIVKEQGLTQPGLFSLGSLLLVSGFLFKVASVPFHMWMPDVYEGAPAPITGFMTTGLKAASFAAFIRVFIATGYGSDLANHFQSTLHDILWVCAALTMLVGNVIALTQTNLKRMLAYSSIAHSGYLLIGFLAGSQNPEGYSAVLLYLVSYVVMNLGAFTILTVMARYRDSGLNLHDLSGLAQQEPWLAFCMSVFMLSLAGVPPTAGFIGKYLLFYSAVQAGETGLVVFGVLCSAISVYYYLRVLVFMYMREPAVTAPTGVSPVSPIPWGSVLALASTVLLTLQVGLIPSSVVEWAKRAVSHL